MENSKGNHSTRSCHCSNNLRQNPSTNEATPLTNPYLSATHRTISVQAEGEIECRPDKFTLTVSITNTKQKLDEAQSSVKRRTNYIIQVLRNHGYHEKYTHVFEEVLRRNIDEHQVKCVITIEGNEMEKILAVKNTLLEKMDPSVTYSSIGCYHSSAHKTKKEEEAFKAAVSLAKSKALSVSQLLGVQLGSILTLVEERLSEREESKEKQHSLDIADFTTITYTSSICAVFEVKRKK